MNQRGLCRFAVVATFLLYGGALAAPAAGVCMVPADPLFEPQRPGISWLLIGFAGPLFGHVGWYANPLLAVAMWRIANRAVIGPILAGLVPALGSSIFLPLSFDAGIDMSVPSHLCHWGIGVLLWFVALCVPLMVCVADRIGRRRNARWCEPL